MTIPGIQVALYLGRVLPDAAPDFITAALQQIEVTCSDSAPNGFQLTFRADRSAGLTSDYALLSSPLLQPFTRLALTVSISGTSTVLMDGFITHQELVYERGAGAASLVVTGEDVSVLMDLAELSFEYPELSDALIVEFVLAKYALVGVLPLVIPSLSDVAPLILERVPQQAATDRQFVQQLAQKHGYIFHVSPGPTLLVNRAYWGPPVRIGPLQPALSVDTGPGTNVESISFKYDALAPTLVRGMVQDRTLEIQVPIVTLFSTRLPPLASDPPLPFNLPFVRSALYQGQQYDAVQAWDCAQATTNVAADKTVTVTGELSTLRYGCVLQAPGLVGVRGAGSTYDGKYYVQSVTHTLTLGDYRQRFTLTREGPGTTTSTVQT